MDVVTMWEEGPAVPRIAVFSASVAFIVKTICSAFPM